MKVLFAWIGNTDLRVSGVGTAPNPNDGVGPIAQAVIASPYDKVVLLTNYPAIKNAAFAEWLAKKTEAEIGIETTELTSPTNYEEIYGHVTRTVAKTLESLRGKPELTFHLSPGTPAMAAIWIIVAKTRFPAVLIESSTVAGVREAIVPFHVSAELIPSVVKPAEEGLERLSMGFRPDQPEFTDIIGNSEPMRQVMLRARECAAYSVPVLVQGESGTGKELLANAIHNSGPRRSGPIICVNCGAIPEGLFESEFFGHKKGSFSGAVSDRKGHFESASGGTLFLDEVGELPKAGQVRLLRVIQERKVTRVGESGERPVDCRIIAATNRDLLKEVTDGHFREDLYYRLAILVLTLPPLRARRGDLTPLVDGLLSRLNDQLPPGVPKKKLSAGARNVLVHHDWPGNIRELEGTLWRATVWASGAVIEERHVRDALFVTPTKKSDGILGRQLGEGFHLDHALAEVAKHYIERALVESKENRTKAAELVGFKSYQRLNDWIEKYKVGP